MKEIKATCTHCGKEITYDTASGLYVHDFGRWPDDNGYYCFENIFQFRADARPMEEIQFRKKFPVTFFDKRKGCWVCENTQTGEVIQDPFLNRAEMIKMAQEIEGLQDQIESLRSMLGSYERLSR